MVVVAVPALVGTYAQAWAPDSWSLFRKKLMDGARVFLARSKAQSEGVPVEWMPLPVPHTPCHRL